MFKILKKDWPILLIIVADFIAAAVLYPALPDKIPTHWNIYGKIDGWGPKNIAAFGIPAMILGIYALMAFIPAIDPKKRNYEKFDRFYSIIKAILVVFFSIVYAITLLAAIKAEINAGAVIVALFGILFMLLGNYMFSVKQNFFIGVRTPWTISDEEVWNMTHRFAAKIWVVSGIVIAILAFISPPVAFIVFLLAAFTPMVYSYVIYKKKNG